MKITRTYSIEESVYNAFDSLATQKNINKSSFIEDLIKKFLKENDMDFIDKVYVMKSDKNKTVTVISQDQTYYWLSDGSKIQKILFMQLFDIVESVSPEKFFKKNTPTVDPQEFFGKTSHIFENLGDKIKDIE